MSHPLVSVSQFTKAWPGFSLGPLEFGIQPGSFVGLIGANGAGKTTLLKALLGLVKPSSGQVQVFGLDPWTNEVAVRSRAGFMFEQQASGDTLKLGDLAALHRTVYKTWEPDRFKALADRFELSWKKNLGSFSTGQRSLAHLLAALCHQAEFLVLDEPTSGLDPAVRREVLDLLRQYLTEGERTVLVSTHLTADLEGTADQLLYLQGGRLIYSGVPEDLTSAWLLLKVGPGVLSAEEAAVLVGRRETPTVVSGLVPRHTLWLSKPGLLLEPVDLDELFVRFSLQEAKP